MTADESASLPDDEEAGRRRAREAAAGGHGSGSRHRRARVRRLVRCCLARGASTRGCANPNVEGRPRPVEFLFGFGHWIVWFEIGTALCWCGLVVVFIIGWRRNPGSPVMLMFLCTTLIVWQDPIMNWAPFAVYNPELLHWPESLAAGVDVADRRTVHRLRLRDVLLRARTSRRSGFCASCRRSAARRRSSRGTRWSALGGTVPGRSGSSSTRFLEISLVRTGHVHLLAGDPVRFDLRRKHLPVPADLGVVRR